MIQSRQKALGQFLTGLPLARLLAAIATAHRTPQSIVDPMCGTGDMLDATRHLIGTSTRLVGVDIDDAAVTAAALRFGGDARVTLRASSAFSPPTWEGLEWPQFDLVITNPPYVRYQAMAWADAHGLPSGGEVRRELRCVARSMPRLHDDDRALFLRLIDAYSGLSDLAVPSWILCAMLVAPGGTLAMVVPETWLSRVYAEPVKWLLLKLFRIRAVVEDASHAWFPDALVKTHLLVADRAPQVGDPIEQRRGASYPFASLFAATTRGSIVAELYPDMPDPDRSFAEDIHSLVSDEPRAAKMPFAFEVHDLGLEAAAVPPQARISATSVGLIQSTAPVEHAGGSLLPRGLREVITSAGRRLVTLAEMGVAVGQGLRTGANPFFYADDVAHEFGQVRLRAHRLLGGGTFLVAAHVVRPVLRTQSELPDSRLTIARDSLTGRVLLLDGLALPEDIERRSADVLPGMDAVASLRPMPNALARHVRLAAEVKLGQDQVKFIPEMSAVRTNVNAQAGRFWYHLPPLVERHRPDLFVARVNHLTPTVWLNLDREVVIDANFATIWLTPRAQLDVYAVLALLNSQWARTVMELTGTVMGGGALKFEANHLRRLPVPLVDSEGQRRLSELGLVLGSADPDVQRKIDFEVSSMIVGSGSADDLTHKLARIGVDARAKRSRAARGVVHARLV